MKKQLISLLFLCASFLSAETAGDKLKDIIKEVPEKVKEVAELGQEAVEEFAQDFKEKLTGNTENEEEKEEDDEEKKAEASENSLELEKLKNFLRKRTKDCFLVNKMKEEPYAVGLLIGATPFLISPKARTVAAAILALGSITGFSIDYFFNKDEAPEKANN